MATPFPIRSGGLPWWVLVPHWCHKTFRVGRELHPLSISNLPERDHLVDGSLLPDF